MNELFGENIGLDSICILVLWMIKQNWVSNVQCSIGLLNEMK